LSGGGTPQGLGNRICTDVARWNKVVQEVLPMPASEFPLLFVLLLLPLARH
jgi:hypothetical protein